MDGKIMESSLWIVVIYLARTKAVSICCSSARIIEALVESSLNRALQSQLSILHVEMTGRCWNLCHPSQPILNTRPKRSIHFLGP